MTPILDEERIAGTGPGARGRPHLLAAAGPPGSVETVRLLGPWRSGAGPGLAAHLQYHGPPALPAGGRGSALEQLARLAEEAGLTGRGGSGFPTARKLRHAARFSRRPGLVVNAMEGEPDSAKDGALLLHAPHLMLDGAQLVAMAMGASRITVCVADDQPAMAGAVEAALAERSGTSLATVATEVARAPGRFVTGEESALVNWLHRGVALPMLRPDKSKPLRLGGHPVLVHNAETLCHLALVARHGPAWFRQVGAAEAPGTALVTVTALSPRASGTAVLACPGVLEVATGTPVDQLVAAARPTAPVAAVLVGGRGGTWLGPSDLAVPFAPRHLAERGAAMGAGILGVLAQDVCPVGELARLAWYMARESAGQCGPCLFGLPAVAGDLAQLAASGTAARSDSDLLGRLYRRLQAVSGRGACRHPDGAVRMIASGLAVFADDVERHARGNPCGRGRP